jgi:hypothetical protein
MGNKKIILLLMVIDILDGNILDRYLLSKDFAPGMMVFCPV